VLLIALALYLPSALSFSSFPVVLLLTTLFRLGIEISTSRSILMRADAGGIVDTFGRFVAGDNLVVGLIVFLIIAIVQFLVITKGAERVAEVAARFSLDSMPGRQMAIDADLRAGFVRPETVQYLRGELARESRMHGAMDGAMKFVKGDAIAGLIIVLVNLIGGITIGTMQHDMPFADALQRYSVLTIGNGLIAQIPALLISIAAATLITRGGEDMPAERRTVGKEIVEQIRAAPFAWVIAGAIVTLFAAVPGMPWFAFLLLAAPMIAFGVQRLRREALARRGTSSSEFAADVVPDEQDIRQIVPVRHIVLSVSRQLAAEARFADVVRAARRTRNHIVMRYGMTVPSIEAEGVSRLEGDAYEIAIHEVVVAAGRFHWDRVCTAAVDDLDDEARAHALPQMFQLIEGGLWIDPERLVRRQGTEAKEGQEGQEGQEGNALPNAGGLSAIDYFARLFATVLHQNAGQFFGIHEAQLLFNWLQRETPAAAKELSQVVALPRFAEVLRLLVAERVSLRNLKQIVEALVTWAPREKDTAMLAECVRLALHAQICQEFASEGTLYAMLLDRDLEEKLRASLQQTARGWTLTIDPETTQSIMQQIRRLIATRQDAANAPVVLTTQDLRRCVRQLLRDELFDVHVLAYSELAPTQRVHPVGNIALGEA
jgi:type III secretion protein V